MWIVMVSMVSGCLMYTVLVANATAMIANIDPAAKEYKSKVLMGDSELHNIKLTLDKLDSQLKQTNVEMWPGEAHKEITSSLRVTSNQSQSFLRSCSNWDSTRVVSLNKTLGFFHR